MNNRRVDNRRPVKKGGAAGSVRMLTTVSAALMSSGCTFGVLNSDECLRRYGEGMAIAVSQAQATGAVARESYGYCLDGKARAKAMLPVLGSHGFSTDGPSKHFEVPGGWCLSGTRSTTADRFNPTQSLAAACAIGHSSRAYMTGGSLATTVGKEHPILSDGDRKAREELDRRLEAGRAR